MNRFKNALVALGLATMLALPVSAAFADDVIGNAPAMPRTPSADERAAIEATQAGYHTPSGVNNPGLQPLPAATFQDASTGYMYIPDLGWYDPRSGLIWVSANGGQWIRVEELGYRNVPPAMIGVVGNFQ